MFLALSFCNLTLFIKVMQAGRVAIVLFFRADCAHCQQARVAFHRAAQTMAAECDPSKLLFVETQCSHALVSVCWVCSVGVLGVHCAFSAVVAIDRQWRR